MTAQYRVLPAADRDLDEQAAYLAAQASLETALRFYDAASSTFAEIVCMAGIGERWPSANPRLAGLRVWRIEGFEKHLIFYRPAADGIEVIRVLHGARDIESVLESGPGVTAV
jgi:toxin ParE1/3/4